VAGGALQLARHALEAGAGTAPLAATGPAAGRLAGKLGALPALRRPSPVLVLLEHLGCDGGVARVEVGLCRPLPGSLAGEDAGSRLAAARLEEELRGLAQAVLALADLGRPGRLVGGQEVVGGRIEEPVSQAQLSGCQRIAPASQGCGILARLAIRLLVGRCQVPDGGLRLGVARRRPGATRKQGNQNEDRAQRCKAEAGRPARECALQPRGCVGRQDARQPHEPVRGSDQPVHGSGYQRLGGKLPGRQGEQSQGEQSPSQRYAERAPHLSSK
jgi:hypothetical protein